MLLLLIYLMINIPMDMRKNAQVMPYETLSAPTKSAPYVQPISPPKVI